MWTARCVLAVAFCCHVVVASRLSGVQHDPALATGSAVFSADDKNRVFVSAGLVALADGKIGAAFTTSSMPNNYSSLPSTLGVHSWAPASSETEIAGDFTVGDTWDEAWSVSPPASPGYTVLDTQASTSRHIGASYPGMNYSLPAAGTVVDTLLARTEGYGTLTRCLFSGIIASADAASHAVVWSRTVPQCSVAPRGDDSLPTAVLSDDGKLMTVAVYMDQMTVSVLLLDASNGSTIATYTPSDATTVGRVSAVSPNAKGDIVAITMGEYVHVVNTSAGTLFGGQASPMHMGDGVTTPATLCPMGVFLITAAPSGSGAGAVIHRWSATAKAYSPAWNTSAPAADWVLVRSATSVNGEDMNADGCIVSLAWSSADHSNVAIDLFSMLSQKHYWRWQQSESSVPSATTVTALHMHLGYTAAAFLGQPQGSGNSSQPTVALFDLVGLVWAPDSTEVPTGSMTDVNVYVQPAVYPPLERFAGASANDTVFIAAAGSAAYAPSVPDAHPPGQATAYRVSLQPRPPGL